MKTVKHVIESAATELTRDQRQQLAAELRSATGLPIYDTSLSYAEGKVLALARDGRSRRLIVATDSQHIAMCQAPVVARKQVELAGAKLGIGILETAPATTRCLRRLLPWTAPGLQGLETSAGLGDRLGLATPGHLQAMAGLGVVPFLAQQSIREMTRTKRSAQLVMDDATWGVFQAGWRTGFGSDADHLKTTADIDTCRGAGFTMYTVDPGDHVRSAADAMSVPQLTDAMTQVAWNDLETSEKELRSRYLDRTFPLDGGEAVRFDDASLMRAVIKYGGAILHTMRMYRHLEQTRCVSGEPGRPRPGGSFELEVSVDETATPSTVAEHYLIASELKRLGVKWVSLAPRFVGEFEKGIDYKGDLNAFRSSFTQHAAVARTLGPYKLSLHSGSDKFSVYPIAAELARGLVHLKTAGTSWLEALRVVARKNPALFRRIIDLAFERFDTDRASYAISARLEAIPRSTQLADSQLESVIDGNDGRQLLHVTYGSVLSTMGADGNYLFRDAILACLIDHEDEHYAVLRSHLGRHVRPFRKGA